MNRTYFSLFIALLIHLLFFLIFFILQNRLDHTSKPPVKKEHRIKVSLREPPKKKIKPITPPLPKGSQFKKITKTKTKTKKIIKKILKKVSKPKIVPKKIVQKEILPKKTIQKKQIEKNPVSWMYEDKTKDVEVPKQSNSSASSIMQDIKKLYGDKFAQLSPVEQKYILDNQEIMRRITQEVLTRVASVNIDRSMQINRSNIIEFYLHPNGDMSDFHFLQKSGIYTLDRTTKETIEYAYSRYPRPKEKTLIRYNVFYNLAHY